MQKKVLTIQNLTILTYFDFKKSFPLGKFKYMGVYLGWFYRQNIRKYVNISLAYLEQFIFLVSK